MKEPVFEHRLLELGLTYKKEGHFFFIYENGEEDWCWCLRNAELMGFLNGCSFMKSKLGR